MLTPARSGPDSPACRVRERAPADGNDNGPGGSHVVMGGDGRDRQQRDQGSLARETPRGSRGKCRGRRIAGFLCSNQPRGGSWHTAYSSRAPTAFSGAVRGPNGRPRGLRPRRGPRIQLARLSPPRTVPRARPSAIPEWRGASSTVSRRARCQPQLSQGSMLRCRTGPSRSAVERRRGALRDSIQSPSSRSETCMPAT